MTTREFLNAVITLSGDDNDELKTKAQELIAGLDKRNASRAAKPSKTAIANAPIKDAIVNYLKADETHTATAADIALALSITSPKASALCRQLVETGILTSEEVKIPRKGKVKAYKIG